REQLIRLRGNSVGLQVRLKSGWNRNAAVGLLESLHQSHEKSGERRAAAIENVRESVLSGLGFETQVHPPRLELFAIRAARTSEIAPLPWRPDFDVVCLGAGKSHIAGAQQHNAVMQPQRLQDAFR